MILIAKHYSISNINSLDELKNIFPEGECNELNFVMFSTSGVHGSYATLEEIENSLALGLSEDDDDYCRNSLTILVIQPRLVNMLYGDIRVEKCDIPYLKKLKESSKKAMLWYFD